MLIDCATCVARDVACDGCVVQVLLDGPDRLDAHERAAIDTLAAAGLVPPLRLVRAVGTAELDAPPTSGPGAARRGIA